jgi:Na+-transporting NADH:ubiquinone oxidoreductase subunit NqrF
MKKYILPVAALMIIGLASCADNDPAPVEKETTIIKEKEVPVKEEVRVEEEPGTRIQVGEDGVEVESKDVDVDVNTEEPKK